MKLSIRLQALEYFPQPLLGPADTDIDYEYLLTLKKEFRCAMNDSPYYITPNVKRSEIERYSDRYQLGQNDSSNQNWEPGEQI